MSERSIPNPDVLASARERVRLEPVPSWVIPCSYSSDFKNKNPVPITYLLNDRQVHAELHQTFIRMALRLETMQAVQDHSQWRVEFSMTETVFLHSVKIRRGSADIEHAALDRLQFLQREAGLEGWSIDGAVTLLLLLEDVRPGDILEWAYTRHSRSALLPDSCLEFFPMVNTIQLSKLHLLVRFAETRPLKWKSSAADLAPAEQRENGEVRWLWARENFLCPDPEEGTPAWHIDYPWIQISDCPDWQTVAASACRAWKEDPPEVLAAMVDQILVAETDPVRQVSRALRLVQDEFRYLSVELGLGGQIPASSQTVIRRRYGDCKDLAFLLVQLLRRLGVQARPVLVPTVLKKSIQQLLPSPNLFNHVIVEYQLANQTHWVDATLKSQGGDALSRFVPNFGLGLPIDLAAAELVPPPPASLQPGVCELKESILVDTAGQPSWISIIETAKGCYAEGLRVQFEREGLEAVGKKRLQDCANRFAYAARRDPIQYRDDREANQFILADVLEISGFLIKDSDPDYCWLQVENRTLYGVLPILPPKMPPRRTPVALPFPCRVVHTIEIESTGLDVAAVPASRVKNDFFEFTCTSRGVRKFTTVTFNLTVLADSVPPQRLADYRKQVDQILPLLAVRVRLPVGYSRMRRRGDFGALPPLPRAPAPPPSAPPSPSSPAAREPVSAAPSSKIAVVNTLPQEHTAKARADLEKVVLMDDQPRPHRSRRSRGHGRASASGSQTKTELLWILAFVGVMAAIMAFLFLMHLAGQR